MEIKRQLIQLKNDKKTRNRVFLITLIMAVFVLALVMTTTNPVKKYVVDKSGRVVKLQRTSLNESEEYELDLTIIDKGESRKKAIRINKQAAENDNFHKEATGNDNKAEQDAEITEIITNIELSQERYINLPTNLSDGTRLIWSVRKKRVGSYILIPLVYLMLIFLVARSSNESTDKVNKDNRQAILISIPRFTNQLLLMLNAGMILNDAVSNIANSYLLIGKDKLGLFEKELVVVVNNNSDFRISAATAITSIASKYNVMELMRIGAILTENEKKGSDIIDNLERESRYLWDDRKIVARERGKLIDTKMTYPLAMLLIVLIVITMAPALLNL